MRCVCVGLFLIVFCCFGFWDWARMFAWCIFMFQCFMFHPNTFLSPATLESMAKKVRPKAFAIQLNIFFCLRCCAELAWKRIYFDITTIITHVANPLTKWPSRQNLIKSDTQFGSMLCQSFYAINIFFSRTIVGEMDAIPSSEMIPCFGFCYIASWNFCAFT